jgi:hypothetical protein
MMYAATRIDLKNIVQWLRGRDESQWEDRTGLLSDSIADLSEMALPLARRDKTSGRSEERDLILSEASEINAAIPHLQAMLSAMERRNREAALEYGKVVLELLVQATPP